MTNQCEKCNETTELGGNYSFYHGKLVSSHSKTDKTYAGSKMHIPVKESTDSEK